MTSRDRRPVAATVQLSKVQTDTVLTQCLQAIMDALSRVSPSNCGAFGRFHLRHRAPRAGRNPRTGETIRFRESRPHLYGGKAFQERVHPRRGGGEPRESTRRSGGAPKEPCRRPRSHARCGGHPACRRGAASTLVAPETCGTVPSVVGFLHRGQTGVAVVSVSPGRSSLTAGVWGWGGPWARPRPAQAGGMPPRTDDYLRQEER